MKKSYLKILFIITVMVWTTGCGQQVEPEVAEKKTAAEEAIEKQQEKKNEQETELSQKLKMTPAGYDIETPEGISKYEDSCMILPEKYKDLLRHEDKMKNENYCFRVQVNQITGDGVIHAWLIEETSAISECEVAFYDCRRQDKTKILVDDELTVYCQYDGTAIYTRSISNQEVEIPTFFLYACEIAGEEREEDVLNADNVSALDDLMISPIEYELDETALQDLSAQELTYLRNSFFARKGYIFKSKELNDFFSTYDWYILDYDATAADLSKTDKKNVEFIKEYQKKNNLEYTPE